MTKLSVTEERWLALLRARPAPGAGEAAAIQEAIESSLQDSGYTGSNRLSRACHAAASAVQSALRPDPGAGEAAELAARRKAIDDLYAVFAPDVVLEAEVEGILSCIVAIDLASALAAAKPSPGLTEPVSCLDDVEHREPVGLSPSQGGVTGSVSHARPDEVERARILDFAFDGVRDDHIGPRERIARAAAAPEPSR